MSTAQVQVGILRVEMCLVRKRKVEMNELDGTRGDWLVGTRPGRMDWCISHAIVAHRYD